MNVHNDSHIFNEDHYQFEPLCQRLKTIQYSIPLSRDILLARDLIVGITIPSSTSFLASTLYSSITQHPLWLTP